MGRGTICCVDGACTMPDATWHGKPTGYNNHRCRCAECRAAWAAYFRDGAGNDAKVRYRKRLLRAGLTTSSSWNAPVPRTNAYGERRTRRAS